MRALKHSKSGSRAAFTLLEMLISTAILAIILGAVGMTVMRGKEQFRQGVTAAVLEARGRRVLDRIVTELQAAGGLALAPDPVPPLGSSTLRFHACTGYDGATQLQTWGPWTEIRLVDDPCDPVDGIDNDGDGMIDEGQVVLIRDSGGPDQVQVTLANGVCRFLEGEKGGDLLDNNGNGLKDEAGLSFVVDTDRTLTIRLSLGAQDPRGRPLIRTVQTAVHMRN